MIAQILEKENAEIRFETLKGQLNPHFLFNSLNVLSSLIGKDAEKAREFVDEFSMVYRYTLDVIDNQVVELSEEMSFVKAFLYLQKIRFDDAMMYDVNIDAEKLNRLVPPLALQTLLENCFKHNRASEDSPLRIKIYDDKNYIVVVK
ncbi:MAG: histidine kinase [Melioribacteraceae bacterium]|nr:histidine kinase [Melioribacteraceae bacterium]